MRSHRSKLRVNKIRTSLRIAPYKRPFRLTTGQKVTNAEPELTKRQWPHPKIETSSRHLSRRGAQFFAYISGLRTSLCRGDICLQWHLLDVRKSLHAGRQWVSVFCGFHRGRFMDRWQVWRTQDVRGSGFVGPHFLRPSWKWSSRPASWQMEVNSSSGTMPLCETRLSKNLFPINITRQLALANFGIVWTTVWITALGLRPFCWQLHVLHHQIFRHKWKRRFRFSDSCFDEHCVENSVKETGVLKYSLLDHFPF